MKITRGHLRALVKESIIAESGWESGVSAADPTVLLDFARAYAKVGTMVQEQFVVVQFIPLKETLIEVFKVVLPH